MPGNNRQVNKIKFCNPNGHPGIDVKQFNEKMDHLRKWRSEDIDSNLPTMSDREVAWFLKGGGYDLDESKKLIMANLKLRQQRPKIFQNRDPLDPEVRAVWNVVYIMKMPLKNNCQSIMYIGLKNSDPRKFDMANSERLFHMCVDMIVEEEDIHDFDFILILDGKGVTFRHFSLHNLPQMKLALDYAQKGLPLTMSGIYVINTSAVVRKLYFLTKPFIDKKLVEKLKFYGSDHKLAQILPARILPYELGGTYGSLDQIQDMEIVLFLTACDYDLEETKKTLECNYRMRTKSSLFKNRSPNKEIIIKSRESVELFVLKERDKEGNVIAGGRLHNTDTSKYHPQGYFEEAVMILEVYQLEMGTVPGLVLIIDVRGTTLRHLLKISLSLTKTILQYAQEAITMKIKAIHFINTRGSVIDPIMAFIRPFLKESLIQKIFFHPEYETLKDHINPRILAEEYGGQGGSIKVLTKECEAKLSSFKKYFSLDEHRRLDESKRPQRGSKYFGWF